MISLMIKPVSSVCNMKCRYCFYRDEEEHRRDRAIKIMQPETVDHIVEMVKEDASIVFQGGEPTLIGLDFYRDFVIKMKYSKAKVDWSMQTNGVLIDRKWCEFFKNNNFLVGLSLDGPEEIHNANRPGSYEYVMNALKLLQQYEVDYSILCVVNKKNCNKAEEIYEFFKEQGINVMQFIPCLDSIDGKEELSAEEYGAFLIRLFDCWKEDIYNCRNISIRYFENVFRILLGMPTESCGFGHCENQYVIESNGDLYPCDFYCLDEYRIGNVDEREKQKETETEFHQDFIGKECLNCRYYRLCKGGCKRDYIDGKNRLCKAYQMFFRHSYEDLLRIRDMLKNQM